MVFSYLTKVKVPQNLWKTFEPLENLRGRRSGLSGFEGWHHVPSLIDEHSQGTPGTDDSHVRPSHRVCRFVGVQVQPSNGLIQIWGERRSCLDVAGQYRIAP